MVSGQLKVETDTGKDCYLTMLFNKYQDMTKDELTRVLTQLTPHKRKDARDVADILSLLGRHLEAAERYRMWGDDALSTWLAIREYHRAGKPQRGRSREDYIFNDETNVIFEYVHWCLMDMESWPATQVRDELIERFVVLVEYVDQWYPKYRKSLCDYGDQLSANGNHALAATQYRMAGGVRSDDPALTWKMIRAYHLAGTPALGDQYIDLLPGDTLYVIEMIAEWPATTARDQLIQTIGCK